MDKFFKNVISRRRFIKISLSGIIALTFGTILPKKLFSKPNKETSGGRKKRGAKGKCDLVLANGDDPYRMTVEAVKAIGGMGRFVKKGSIVTIKPNMSWDNAPEYATNTNPAVVAAAVELCFQAGAKRVNVFDRTCNSEKRCYENSGVREAAESKGAKVFFVDDWNTVEARFDYDSFMQGWPIYRDAIECDTFINIPVLKHHGLTGLTLSMKNLMGVCGGGRGQMHGDIGRHLVDITDFISPDLTIIDACRVLTKNGPSGGNLADVVDMKKLIVATDPTLADTYACSLMDKDPMSVPYIAEAAKRNFGSFDIEKADIIKLDV